MINLTIVTQDSGDICEKLQKLDFVGMKTAQLLEVANKIFIYWDVEKHQEAEWHMRKNADLIAIAFAGRPTGTL